MEGREKSLLSIQYLRAAAAMAVVGYHALQWRTGGFDVGRAGVDVFFVISGFIMWRVTAGRAAAPGIFVWRRFTRVAPLYWIATLLVAAVAAVWPGFLPQVRPGLAHLALSLAFIPHLDPAGLPFPTLPPGWTLVYEAIFYGVFAACLTAPARWRATAVTAALTAIVAAGFALDDPVYILGANPMLLQFAAGVWLGVAAGAGALPGRAWGGALIVAGLALLALTQVGGLFVELWRPLSWGVPAAMIVGGAVSLETPGAFPNLPALTRLGDASYSLYLFHLPALALVAHTVGVRNPWLFVPLALAAAIGAGLAGHLGIEKPLLAWLRGRRRPTWRPITAT